MNILLISTCKYSLHEFEFVKPVIQILHKNKISYKVIHISKIKTTLLLNYSQIIICGTAIKDFHYFKFNINSFLAKVQKNSIPVLGICSGAQILAKFLSIPLNQNSTNSIIKLKNISNCEIFKLEKNQILDSYSLHTYNLGLKDIFSNNISFSTLLVQEEHIEDIELIRIKCFTLCFFHIEIKNKQLLINWINNTSKFN